MRKLSHPYTRGVLLGGVTVAVFAATILAAALVQAQATQPAGPDAGEAASAGTWTPPVGTVFTFTRPNVGQITARVDYTAPLTTTGATYYVWTGAVQEEQPYSGGFTVSLANGNQSAIFQLTSIWPYTTGQIIEFDVPVAGASQLLRGTYTIRANTRTYLPIVRTIAAPGAFFKQSPANNATNQPLSLNLTWSESSYAASYEVCLSTSLADCLAVNPTGFTRTATTTSLAVGPLAPNATYYWHVRARNYLGTVYSDNNQLAYFTFTTGAVPGAFAKTAPEDGSYVLPAGTTLTWDAASGATDYDVCLGTSAAVCATPAGFTTKVYVPAYATGPLADGVTYYWHVRANNATGSVYSDGDITAVYSFMSRSKVVPGTDQCSAIAAPAFVNIPTSQENANGYFALTVDTTSTVAIAIGSFSGGGQLQFITPNTAACPLISTKLIMYSVVTSGGTNFTYYNVTPGVYYARIYASAPSSNTYQFRWEVTPNSSSSPSPDNFYEPNDTACTAATAVVNTPYSAFAENSRPDLNTGAYFGVGDDYYQFTLSAATNVVVGYSSYNVVTNQVQLLYVPFGGTCANRVLVDSTSYLANRTSGSIARTLQAGLYYVRFAAMAGATSYAPLTSYTFSIATGSAVNPQVETCPAFTGCQANSSDGTLTIYWRGMFGASSIQIWLKSWGLVGCSLGDPNSASPGGYASGYKALPVVSESGSFVFSNFSTGGYAFFANANPTANPTFHDEKPFRVKCGFRNFWTPRQPPVLGPGLESQGDTYPPTTDDSQPMPPPVP